MQMRLVAILLVGCAGHSASFDVDAGRDASIADTSPAADSSCKPSRDELCGSMVCGYAGDDNCGHHVDCGKCGTLELCGARGPNGTPAVVGQCGCTPRDQMTACALQAPGTCGHQTNGCNPKDPRFSGSYDCDACGFPAWCSDISAQACSTACVAKGATQACASNTGFPNEVDCSPADQYPGGTAQTANTCVKSGSSTVTAFWCCK